MVRAGVSLPALLTLLGHVKTKMMMKYVRAAQPDGADLVCKHAVEA